MEFICSLSDEDVDEEQEEVDPERSKRHDHDVIEKHPQDLDEKKEFDASNVHSKEAGKAKQEITSETDESTKSSHNINSSTTGNKRTNLCWVSDDEDESEDEVGTEVKTHSRENEVKTSGRVAIPSAKDLLQGVSKNSASILSGGIDKFASENIIPSFKSKIFEEEKKQPEKKSTPAVLAKPAISFEELQAKEAAALAGPSGSKKNPREAETAKDRIKRQRLQGQSGIGDDFRTWRTEEEMKNRQQFD